MPVTDLCVAAPREEGSASTVLCTLLSSLFLTFPQFAFTCLP